MFLKHLLESADLPGLIFKQVPEVGRAVISLHRMLDAFLQVCNLAGFCAVFRPQDVDFVSQLDDLFRQVLVMDLAEPLALVHRFVLADFKLLFKLSREHRHGFNLSLLLHNLRIKLARSSFHVLKPSHFSFKRLLKLVVLVLLVSDVGLETIDFLEQVSHILVFVRQLINTVCFGLCNPTVSISLDLLLPYFKLGMYIVDLGCVCFLFLFPDLLKLLCELLGLLFWHYRVRLG